MLKSAGLEDNTAGALALAAATAGCLALSAADLQPVRDQDGQLQLEQLQGVFRSWDSLCSTFACRQDASGQVRRCHYCSAGATVLKPSLKVADTICAQATTMLMSRLWVQVQLDLAAVATVYDAFAEASDA